MSSGRMSVWAGLPVSRVACDAFGQELRQRLPSPGLLSPLGSRHTHHSRFSSVITLDVFSFTLHFFKRHLKWIFVIYLDHFLHWSLVAVWRPMSGNSLLTAPVTFSDEPHPVEELDLLSLDLVSGPGSATHLLCDLGQATSISPPYLLHYKVLKSSQGF